MDVGGADGERLTGAVLGALVLPAELEAVVADAPADHVHRPGREVVVVKAGVGGLVPVDQPRAQALAAEELLIATSLRIVHLTGRD